MGLALRKGRIFLDVCGQPSSVRVELVSPLHTFRRRWTVDLYQRSCLESYDDEARFGQTELNVCPL